MLDLTWLNGKKILVLGAGLSGMSCARFLAKHRIEFALNDSREHIVNQESFKQEFPNQTLSLGCWDKDLINDADIILVSPGIDTAIPQISRHISSHTQMFGDVELFFRLKQLPTIAVTGSNGKSTVVSLVHHIGQTLGINTQLGGNIGVPLLDVIEDDVALLVLELSSFQLETLSSMTATATTLLNVSDDHLDRHKTMENYQQIKQRIHLNTQCAVVNRDDKASHYDGKSPVISFGESIPVAGEFGLANIEQETHLMFGDKALIATNKLPIAGKHNATNCLAALALGYAANWPLDEMIAALMTFEGLSHRCQKVPTNDGISWINDSKATNVGATIAAIEGLSNPNHKLIVIAGGQGKGADFSPLTSILEQHVDHLIVMGEDKSLIKSACPKTVKLSDVASLNEAVALAKEEASVGDVVLFSPACASFDMFKNFAQRGDAFVHLVNEVSQ